MSTDLHIQTSFLNMVKEKTDPAISFVDELAELLSISKDSAYRRLRGETLLSFEEISQISERYRVSVDGFLNLQSSNSITFNTQHFNHGFSFDQYLSSIRDHLELLNRFEARRMIYAAKDIPPMHYYQFPNLTWFKSFFWQKTILNREDLSGVSFESIPLDKNILGLCKGIWNQFISVPSIEIWTEETINITLRQIEYYFDSGLIGVGAQNVLDELMQLVSHLREEARVGRKMHFGAPTSGQSGTFQLYFNEIAIGDNTALFEMDQKRTVFLNYNMLSLMSTSDPRFCEVINQYLTNILQKSTLISAAGEKERNRFFNRMEAKVVALQNKVKGSGG